VSIGIAMAQSVGLVSGGAAVACSFGKLLSLVSSAPPLPLSIRQIPLVLKDGPLFNANKGRLTTFVQFFHQFVKGAKDDL
jgi:hypothetical protein